MSLKQNLLKNGFASAIQKALRIAEQLLLVPFFISAWGAAYYGEWLTLTIIPTVIGLSDFGFGTAAANAFILRYAAGDKKGASNMVASGFRMINIVVIACISISILIILILDYLHVFEKSLIQSGEAKMAVFFLMIARLFGFYYQLYQAYFKAARKAALGINLMNILMALNIFGGLLVLLLGGGIVIYSLTLFVISVFFLIFFAFLASRTLPFRKTEKGQVNSLDVKIVSKNGFGYMLSTLWQAIFFQGTTFVVRITLGPVAVTIFNTVRTFVRSVSQVNGMIIGSVIPELQFEIGANNYEKARKMYRYALTAIVIISILGMTFLYVAGPGLYELWTQKALNPPPMMWNIFILGILFNGLWWLSGDVLIFANKPFAFTVPALIASLIAIILSYFLILKFGLIGAAFTTLLLDFTLVMWVLPKACKLLKQPFKTLIKEIIEDLKLSRAHRTESLK